MSLYDDDFDVSLKEQLNNSPKVDTNASKRVDLASNWNANSLKLLQSQLQAKKHQQHLSLKRPKQSLIKTQTSLVQAPNQDIQEFKNEEIKVHDQVAPLLYECEDEYDPMRPNDYEKLIKYQRTAVSNHDSNSSSSDYSGKHSSHSRSTHKRNVSPSRYSSSNSGRRSTKGDFNETNQSKQVNFTSGASFAPPASLIEEDKKLNVSCIDDASLQSTKMESPLKSSTMASNAGLTLAEKMMAKMGYKEGDGLGRNKQGMSQALQVEKIGLRVGRIIHEKDAKAVTVEVQQPPKEPIGISNELMKNQSKVILLTNMVGPGEVDSELEGETKEECQKYGEVCKVAIREIQNTIPEESVRIFVEFKTQASAIKALVDLNGRFFAGRKVKATFYNIDKFHRLELTDEV